jgi:ADP-heptose:LPS heptosyltransferase
MKRKFLLKNFLSPGDIVMLTAAVRDLHGQYPGRFVTDVRTSCPELWEHNPYLTPLDEDDPKVEVLECHYPLINRCNQAPYHCVHGFIEYLNDCLELDIRPSLFKGDIHLSAQEKAWFSQVHEMTSEDTPFWIVATGGKFDVTVKWWDIARYQEVVDHFRGKIQFVQVGEAGHYHPPLEGAIDLRGQTDLRQLVRLMYHAQGVVCPVTCLMHLAAAIETKPGMPPHRPCVVIAGGREPPHWEAYPHHQFIHTIGTLPCCQRGGCWRSRTQPLGDGDVRDRRRDLCLETVGELPRCMDMIPAAEVIRRIHLYFAGGALEYLSPAQARRARKAIASENPAPNRRAPLTIYNARMAANRFIERMPPYPGGFRGQGIVICAGGIRLFTNAWVCVQLLRRLGCRLPIELWHLGNRNWTGPCRRW